MTRSGSRTRGLLGLVLCAVTTATSVVAPLMERGGFLSHTAVESEHDPARCASPHDHRICTQVGANMALGSRMQDQHVAHVLPERAPATDARRTSARPVVDGPPSRAPPLA